MLAASDSKTGTSGDNATFTPAIIASHDASAPKVGDTVAIPVLDDRMKVDERDPTEPDSNEGTEGEIGPNMPSYS